MRKSKLILQTQKPKMNLRIKILIGSLILSLIVSVSLAYTSFKILQNELYEECGFSPKQIAETVIELISEKKNAKVS